MYKIFITFKTSSIFSFKNLILYEKYVIKILFFSLILLKVTNLKIQSNPFARGFRGDWRKTKAKRNSKKGGAGLNSSTTSTSYEDCMMGGEEGDEEGDDENYAHHHHVSGDTIMNSEDDENDEQIQGQSTSTSFDDKENESRFLDNDTVTIKVEPEY